MRVIGGKNRGVKLFSIETEKTRPTLDRVKENVFNILENKIKNIFDEEQRKTIFLDLFSGFGGIGIEAFSRGFDKVIFIEKEKDIFKILSKNIEKVTKNDLERQRVKIYNLDLIEYILIKLEKDIEYNSTLIVAYIDPPYTFSFDDIYIYLQNMTKKFNNMQEEVNISVIYIIESEKDFSKDILDKNLKYLWIDKRKYGRANLLFLRER